MSEPLRAFLVATGAAQLLSAGDVRLAELAQKFGISLTEAQAVLAAVQQ
jgi:hypothetical protein